MVAREPTSQAERYLRTLCLDIPQRSVGSAGNGAATEFAARTLGGLRFRVETPAFDCMDWTAEGASLSAGGVEFDVHASPYSLGGPRLGGTRRRLDSGGTGGRRGGRPGVALAG